jgi:hypothetical protein
MRKNLFLQLFIITLISLSACNDNDENPNPDTAKNHSQAELLLTNHAWKLEEEIQVNITGTYITNQNNMNSCDKDDFQTFQTDGILVFDAGIEKCDPRNSQTNKTTWAFTNNDMVLKIANRSNQIIEFNENKLVYKYTSMSTIDTTTITTTLVKK